MNTVTLGGLTIGLTIIVVNAIRWWHHEHRKPAALATFLLAIAYGILAVLSAGGFLGGLAHITLWGSNGLGDLGLVYGVGGHTRDITGTNDRALTDGGHAIVFIATFVVLALAKYARSVSAWKLLLGSLAGVSLGLVGTIAGAAAVPLASAVNAAGIPLTAMMQ